MRPPKRSVSGAGGVAASRAIVAIPSSSSRSAVFGPMPGIAGRRVGEALARLLAREHEEALGLLGVGGDLGHEPVRPMPTEA